MKKELLIAILELISHPQAQVSKYYAALLILDAMEKAGQKLPEKLALAIASNSAGDAKQIIGEELERLAEVEAIARQLRLHISPSKD